MIRALTTFAVTASLMTGAAIVGCDKTVAEKTTEKTNSDGTSSVDKTKTTQAPDGSMKTTKEHSSDMK